MSKDSEIWPGQRFKIRGDKKTKEPEWRRREKETKCEETKKRKEVDYDDNNSKEGEKKKRNRKKTRMGKCLAIVPLSLWTDALSLDYSNEFFDEDLVSGDESRQYWPEDLVDVPEVDIDSEEYLSGFLEAVSPDAWWTNHAGPGKREIKSNSSHPVQFNVSCSGRSSST